MINRIDILKGIHPGKIIERGLKKRNLTQRYLAQATNIPYQTINAIIGGRRKLTTAQALKIETMLEYEEGFLLLLQVYFEIQQHKDKKLAQLYPTAPDIRKSLFWDADFDSINWGKHKQAVVTRVLERGSQEEIEEIQRFYDMSVNEIKAAYIVRNKKRKNEADE